MTSERKTLDVAVEHIEHALRAVGGGSREPCVVTLAAPIKVRAAARIERYWSPESRAIASARLRTRWRKLKREGKTRLE